jgi:hypothetical protein
VKIKAKPSLILWTFISCFLVVWLGIDLFQGVYRGELQDLRTGNSLSIDSRPVWFALVFILKFIAISGCIYFLYGVSQIIGAMVKNERRNKARRKRADRQG